MKLHYETKSKLGNGDSSFGFIIRDSQGELVLLGAKRLFKSCSILKAEAWGMREGIKAALSIGIKNIHIEGDNLSVINSLRKLWKIPWEIHSLVSDADVDLRRFDRVIINHCFREANGAADFMAHKGHLCPDLLLSRETQDLALLSIIRKDALGWSHERG
ncbi:uncharacterized protein LOC104898794 [Beta vulgaris subsp. vulgaris]|uniref:uncharacterized protein LOC104898794 n=1 Tax=Beta vulgaris subsp. vulgaris TaxID=3555 RepID=UPI00054028A8|nr:uncharacterized protein LOC104898794 [Beta vulgaris subsp. vulgaris]